MQRTFLCSTVVLLLALRLSTTLSAQSTFPALEIRKNTPSAHAFVHCNIVRAPGDIVTDGTLVIRDGNVENVGINISIPPGVPVHDLHGAWIFPGFIDAYTSLGIEKPKREPEPYGAPPQYESKSKGPWGWNDAVKPQVAAAEVVNPDKKALAELRSLGFTTLHVVPNDGIFRGTSAVINLGEDGLQREMVQSTLGSCMSFDKGSSTQSYPSSLMGSIALIRQTLIDAAWYARVLAERKQRPILPQIETNLSLEAINQQFAAKLPVFFECGDWQSIARAQKIASEFGLQLIFKTDGSAYQRLDMPSLKSSPLIIPLNFPEAFEVKDPADAREVPLRKLLHWEAAPTNPGVLEKAGARFALTTTDLKKVTDFWPMLQKALRHGLSSEAALAALTTTPAAMLGLEKRVGTLEPGKLANFFIADDDVFAKEKVTIYESWVSGRRYLVQEMPSWDPRGQYDLKAGNELLRLLIHGRLAQPKASLVMGKDTIDGNLKLDNLNIALNLPIKKGNPNPQYRLYGIGIGDRLQGEGVALDGARMTWAATLMGQMPTKVDTAGQLKRFDLTDIAKPTLPFGPYGNSKIPEQKVWLIKNVTVWTNTSKGKLENAEVLIAAGKVQSVGQNLLQPPGAVVIDGKGMHITSGIIDEHSHIAIAGDVNEGTNSNTAEVRIGDVINSDDVNIYRQLSGGVTTSQLLHGSANAIGGQSAIIKLRWGAMPEEMKFQAAPGFIKFALGENVKQSNWGQQFTIRYPQTRLGVEQFVRDCFTAALDYRKQLEEEAKGVGNRLPIRKDLQLETLLEILDNKRFITCHSYVQSEILMLMRLAESIGFRINTFTHVLEGYKVAEQLKTHGANASTFSDWWAYKYEVIDAIPHNADLMRRMGVNVCINSDDAEMGRRLNQEAAKSVMYGGMSEEDALKMVTLNPAKALHIDQYVGSIESGKDADLVLWNDHPLSVYAMVQKTFIDGRLYFDREADAAAQRHIAAERQRLIQKMIESPDKDKKKFEGKNGPQIHHCESYGHEE